MYKLHITIQGLPKTTNSGGRQHWAVKVKEAQRWVSLVKFHSLGKIPHTPLKKAKLKFIRHSAIAPDFDGIVSSFKHLSDGLVRAGILEDDNMSVTGTPEYKWEKVARGSGFIEIFVEENLENEAK